ncbi:oligosaccharide flippase family protein [Paeniglutamicibacter cryotolerans]
MPSTRESPLHSHLSGIARSGTLNMLGAAIAAVLNFVLIVVVTQSFDPTTAGMLFSATSIFLIALSVSSLGTDAGLARFLLRFKSMNRQADMGPVVRIARIPVLICSLLLALLGIIFAPTISSLTGLGNNSGTTLTIVLMALLPIAALGDFSLAAARALGTFKSTVLSEKLLRPVLQPAGALLVALFSGGVLWLATSWAIPYVLSAFLSVFLFHQVFRPYRQVPMDVIPTPVPELRHEFWTFTWPRAVARISQAIIQRADIILVAALIGPAQAAVYTAATRFVALGQFGVNAIQQVLQPRFSQILALETAATAERVFKVATSWNMAVAWPLYVVAIIGVNHYLMIFGNGYDNPSARTVVLVMGLAMMFATAAGPLDTMLLMAGKSTVSLWISLIGLAFNIGLCLVFIPAFQILGAAMAWAVAIAVRNTLTFLSVRTLLGITPWSRGALLVSVSAITSFAIPLAPVALSGTDELLPFFLAFAVGCLCYLGFLWLCRRPLELSSFRDLRPRSASRQV